ncbi:MAG TPA: hypothetical protein DCY47_20575, partial [Candidatus Accumulibacter sp.]|nr:hypothetical protein [Accumulibacter sp.]
MGGSLAEEDIDGDVGRDRRQQHESDDRHANPIDVPRRVQITDDGLVPMLLQRGRKTEDEQRDRRAKARRCDLDRADPA